MYFSEYRNIEEFKEANGYAIDALWYPRVTKIIDIKSKPALYRFYGDAPSFKAAKEVTEISAKEGSLIHETVEKIMMGEHPFIPPTISPAVYAATKFIAERGIEVDIPYIEKRICNKEHRFAGTIDAIALIDGRYGILDIKTSQSIYRDYNLQTSAYLATLMQELPNLTTRWILRIDQVQYCANCKATLRPKGGRLKLRSNGATACPPDKHIFGPLTGVVELKEMHEWSRDFKAFLGAKTLWEWENEEWLKKIGYA